MGIHAPDPNALATLGVALLFAVVFVAGGRAAEWTGHRGYRRFLSFSAGVSVAYIFVHVLPALHAIGEYHMRSPGHSMLFPEHGAYLWTMAGFLAFYGLETMAGAQSAPQGQAAGTGVAAPQRPGLHVGGFALYAWILTYMMAWTGKDGLALVLFAAAMGLHLFTVASNLGAQYRELYRRRGALLLALASLAGWGAAVTLELPVAWVLNLVAFVMGGVVVNAAIAELPREKGGRYWAFVAGAASYTALLLALSKFEKGA